MKPSPVILAVFVLLGILIPASAISWIAFDWSRERSPRTYAKWLDTTPSVYTGVEPVAKSDLVMRAYAYELNKYVDAIPNASRYPRIADENGFVPAFRLNENTFILTWKWKNSSAGLAISDSPDFESQIESLDDRFQVRHLSDNVYEWTLDLETRASDEIQDSDEK